MKYDIIDALKTGWHNFEDNIDMEKELCWVLSNIVATHQVDIITVVLQNVYILTRVQRAIHSGNVYLAKEGLYVIANILGCTDPECLDDVILSRDVF